MLTISGTRYHPLLSCSTKKKEVIYNEAHPTEWNSIKHSNKKLQLSLSLSLSLSVIDFAKYRATTKHTSKSYSSTSSARSGVQML
jgi:hypothetical protein